MTDYVEDLFAEAHHELLTVRDMLRFAVSRFRAANLFFGHGSDTAWDEATYLILHTLNLPLDQLEPFLDARLTGSERSAVLDIIGRRVNTRLPAAYLTHEAWLGEYRFYVDEHVIVPRSFIAELLREELAPWIADTEGVERVLDLCTGSGCLAIIAALTFPNAAVDAAELSVDALEVAKRNIRDYQLGGRVRPLFSDMFGGLKGRSYDLIVSNPPYVTAESMQALPAEYRAEPALALGSGDDGLDHVRTIIAEAPGHLNPGGLLVVEVGFNREGVEAAFPQLPLTWAETSAGNGVVFLITREELLATSR
ncbi:MAG TPA: 50S ribosomal protein L3 N(5)-glutamine methyltransferase [Usitatibacteraceae bacterium]